ncbi:MAG TPA: DUF2252 domain-containing protein [Acidimicrobiales bacterium]
MRRGTPAERSSFGRRIRGRVPRAGHGEWEPPRARTDPLEILALQATTRIPELVPIRYGRMAASAFAFFRGAAAVMAADLAHMEQTGLEVQLCGDAHLSNFGGFASPERDLIFDVNDFDETVPGPFEWDLKRLAASLEIASRSRHLDQGVRSSIVAQGACSYRAAMREFATMRDLEIWYSRLDTATIAARWGAQAGHKVAETFQRRVTKAQSKDHLAALGKLTSQVDGELRFVHNPPLMVPADDVFTDVYSKQTVGNLYDAMSEYRHTLSGDRQRLLDKYEFVDLARKVVGVGSVGTRCWVALFVGRDLADPLFLQVKEAESAVGEPFLGTSEFSHHGQRVVEGQRLMQGASDIFLGWDRFLGEDGVARDFYVRQLWDWKASFDVEQVTPEVFGIYAQMCGWTLARAHARSGDAIAMSSYLGRGDRFDQAMCRFASSYADQNERDFAALGRAIAAGQVYAISGL